MPRGIYDRSKAKRKPGRPKGAKNKTIKSVWSKVPEVTDLRTPQSCTVTLHCLDYDDMRILIEFALNNDLGTVKIDND